jgi:hypothetical protein
LVKVDTKGYGLRKRGPKTITKPVL